MSVSMKDRKSVIYGEVERLRALLDRRDQQIEALEERFEAKLNTRPAPTRSALAAKFDARRDAARRFLAANPGRSSATLAEVVAFMEAQR